MTELIILSLKFLFVLTLVLKLDVVLEHEKLFLLFLIFGFNTLIEAKPYPRHKYTCPETGGKCNEEERAVVKLVNDTYWEMLTKRIEHNTHYKYPWYWVYKRGECKYTVGAKEDMPTHVVNMEWIEVDICKKTTKIMDLRRR